MREAECSAPSVSGEDGPTENRIPKRRRGAAKEIYRLPAGTMSRSVEVEIGGGFEDLATSDRDVRHQPTLRPKDLVIAIDHLELARLDVQDREVRRPADRQRTLRIRHAQCPRWLDRGHADNVEDRHAKSPHLGHRSDHAPSLRDLCFHPSDISVHVTRDDIGVDPSIHSAASG